MVVTDFFGKSASRSAVVALALGAFAIGSISGCSIVRRTKRTVSDATAGAAVERGTGDYTNQLAAELSRIEGLKTETMADGIRITWSSAALFEFDSAMLTAESQRDLEQIAEVVAKFPDTDILIAGHTDSWGSDEYNQKLSERRAMSVRECLVELGVAPSRLRSEGRGERYPVASNDTEEGRDLNRRVEIEIRVDKGSRGPAAARGNQG